MYVQYVYIHVFMYVCMYTGELNAVFGFKSAITAKEKDKSGGSATKPYKK